MSAVSEIEAAIAAERTEVQGKLKDLQDQINNMSTISDEDKNTIIAQIQGISEP